MSLARPRDRKTLNHDAEFKRLRAHITEKLLGYGTKARQTQSRKLVLPDILPEDLDQPRRNGPPRRPSEEKRETIVST